MHRLTVCMMLLGLSLVTSKASAAVSVVGGSNILVDGDADQLGSWLAEPNIVLTNIFSKTSSDGQTPLDFHAAVDGMGRTFSLLKITTGIEVPIEEVIGGYNPQSWNSSGGYNYTPTDAERTAFIFNLTWVEKQSQKLTSDPDGYAGEYQTYNNSDYGPAFGGGWDIGTHYQSLEAGYAYNYSYGPGHGADNILGILGDNPVVSTAFTIVSLEVFTISEAAAVPEPTSLVIWSLVALTSCGGAWWRRRRRAS